MRDTKGMRETLSGMKRVHDKEWSEPERLGEAL